MNNIIKKVSAFAIALTLLGTGTHISKPGNTLNAHAASAASGTCMHFIARHSWPDPIYTQLTHYVDYCPVCGMVFGGGKKVGPPPPF